MIDDLRVAMIAGILLFSGFAGMTAAYGAAATDEGSVSATVTVAHEEPIDLVGTDIRNETITHNGSELNRSTDYDLDERRGHIYFLENGSVAPGDQATAEYEADVPQRLAERIRGPMGNVTLVAGAGVFVLLIIVALSALSSFERRI